MPTTPAQSVTVDYLVTGSLDGSTAAPEVSRSGANNTPFDKDAQIYEPEPAAELGVVDPDLGFGGSIGPRCVGQLLVDLRGELGAPGSRVYVAAQKGDELIEIQGVLDLAGVDVAVAKVPFVVPQGGVLVFEGVSAGAEPILIRLSVETPEDPSQLLATLAVAAASGDGGGGVTGCCLAYSESVVAPGAALSVELAVGVLQRFDPSGVAGDELEFVFPAAPAKDDHTGIKEWADSAVPVKLNGNGATVETVTAAAAAVQSTGIARQSLNWQYDGVGTWRLV